MAVSIYESLLKISPVKPLDCMVQERPRSTKALNNCAPNCSQKIKKTQQNNKLQSGTVHSGNKRTDNKNKLK